MIPTLGTCYYPEHWPEAQWAEDAQRMADLGLTWVRIGEFSWSRIEAKQGVYDWSWLDRAVDTLGQAGLKVVMGTPTATPPFWMVAKHPDMLAVDANNNVRKFGSRRHYCFSYLPYRDECAKIVSAMAQRYGSNPYVQAWQTDNEYGCHDTTISYSDAARTGFRNWLAQKYQSPDALNRAWGNVFWSMEYDDFDNIDLPNQTVTEPNPSHVMDFRRYTSDQVVSFNKVQSDILRNYTDAPLIHNYMGRTTDFDHYDVGADLDIASWDSYPLGMLEWLSPENDDYKRDYAQQGDPDFQAFHHDLYRTVGRGRLWIMEQQPGPVNWAPYNPAPKDGMVRLWSWEAIAHGAEAVCYFRWRQAPFAQEHMHAGLLRTDSEPAPAFAQAAQVSAEISEMGAVNIHKAKVALVFDYASHWAVETQRQGASFSYFDLVFEHYRTLRKLGLSIDIIGLREDEDLSQYDLISVPGFFALSQTQKTRLSAHDGTVLYGPRSNHKTENYAMPTTLAPNISGLDVVVELIETLRPNDMRDVAQGGKAKDWIEKLTGTSPTIMSTVDGAAILMGEGGQFYLGASLDQEALLQVYKIVCANADLTTVMLSEGLRLRETNEHTFVFNYGPSAAQYAGTTLKVGDCIWIDK
jgi:beta-galactosidase